MIKKKSSGKEQLGGCCSKAHQGRICKRVASVKRSFQSRNQVRRRRHGRAANIIIYKGASIKRPCRLANMFNVLGHAHVFTQHEERRRCKNIKRWQSSVIQKIKIKTNQSSFLLLLFSIKKTREENVVLKKKRI